VSLHFGSAPHFAFIDVEERQIVGSCIKANEGKILSHKKGIQAVNLLIGENVIAVLAGGIGRRPIPHNGNQVNTDLFSLQIYETKRCG
jgi:predicted Fe-Mo cluster-binding NifX family protein